MQSMFINRKDAYFRVFDLVLSRRPGHVEYADSAPYYECGIEYGIRITHYAHFAFSSRSCT